jgi:hypothetical protein
MDPARAVAGMSEPQVKMPYCSIDKLFYVIGSECIFCLGRKFEEENGQVHGALKAVLDEEFQDPGAGQSLQKPRGGCF